MMLTAQADNGQIKIKESDLTGHLLNGEKQDKLQKKKTVEQKQTDEIASKLRSDYKVHEALNLLRGMHILSAAQSAKIDKSKEYE